MTDRSRRRVRGTFLGAFLAVPILFGSAPAAALWERSGDHAGVSEALAAGDYPAVVRMLRQLADDGDMLAQTLLAELYLGELGAAQNMNLAIAWMEQAAAEGSIHAMLRLGSIYKWHGAQLTGGPMHDSWPAAVQWFCRAADAGSAEGAFQAGRIYSLRMVSRLVDTLSPEEEEALARRYLEQAAAAGHARALFRLAVMHRREPDHVDRLRQAAQGQDGIDAQAMLAVAPPAISDEIPPRELYFWSLVTQRNLELTKNQWVVILDGATPEEFAGFVDEAAEALTAAEHSEVEAEVDAFVADWVDPYPR